MAELSGLTEQQVLDRRQKGQGNNLRLSTSRPYAQIVLTNVFNPVNLVLYATGIGLAIGTLALVFFNAVVGIVQEVRSKAQLDHIALLARAKVTVRRDGREQSVDPSELVLGDLLIIRTGDQIPVDGTLVGGSAVEIDESALTGESEPVRKVDGDPVRSGSFCVSGAAQVEATGVGEKSFANELTTGARTFSLEETPLQRGVSRMLRILVLIVVYFIFLAILALAVLQVPLATWLQIVAVITGTVSVGLLTLITLNYSWGAVRIGRQGALVQQLNAVEGLSNVTVLCTDKTGTLTSNTIAYHDSFPIGMDQATLQALLADFAASASTRNKTTQAIADRWPGVPRKVVDEVPFSSDRKWSALAFDDPGEAGRAPLHGAYVLGAIEMLAGRLMIDAAARQQHAAWTAQGLRVLAFGHNSEVSVLHDATGDPSLPSLVPLGLVCFSDVLRPHLRETLDALAANQVKLKVISGDDPQTVAALARQAGLTGDLRAVSGPELAQLSDADFAQAAADATVFGRILPAQKRALVEALRSGGEYVAMIGDGVNDVLALKRANLGIAMESGSSAARAVAAIVLLGDSFAAVPVAFAEGQRIVNSIRSILKLFLVTVFALLLLIIGITLLRVGFPFTTLQSTLLSVFVRGVPPLVLGVTAVGGRPWGSLLGDIVHFTLPASMLMFGFGLLTYVGVYFEVQEAHAADLVSPDLPTLVGWYAGHDLRSLAPDALSVRIATLAAQTALTGYFVLAGVLLLVFADPPIEWLAGGAPCHHHWLPTVVSVGLLLAYGAILVTPPVRSAFELVALAPSVYLLLAALTALWGIILLVAWRQSWLERLLRIDVSPSPT
jgi:cation-transporting ATPase E